MSGNGSLPLRDPSEPQRPNYDTFLAMHKQFAAMQLKLKERVEKEDKEREEAARAPPKLQSPIDFKERNKGFDERVNNVAQQLENPYVLMHHKRVMDGANRVIVGFGGSVRLPYYKYIIDDEAIKDAPVGDNNKEKRVAPCLAEMPPEVIQAILVELYPQWQICFALSSKRVSKISKTINGGWGIVYGQAAKLHILWRLESWMTYSRKLCMSCEKYYPVSTAYWMDRKKYGPCNTASRLYGRSYCDYEFVEGKCPECVANGKWRGVCKASATLQLHPSADEETKKV